MTTSARVARPLAGQDDRVLLLDREVLPLLGWGDSILDDHLQNTVAERRAHLSADTWNKKKADQKQ